jgi:O-Antigen ligase
VSAWPSQPARLVRRRPAAGGYLTPGFRLPKTRTVLWLAGLVAILIAEGAALSQSYLLAAPLAGLLLVAVAAELPLVPFLGSVLLVRILTDASLSSQTIRHTSSLNLSGAIALGFILVACGLLIRRRQGVQAATLAFLFLAISTAVAVNTHGLSTETVREGVRELSVVAIAVIVLNARGSLNISTVTRMIQVVAFVPALIAIDQFATHKGTLINGEIRAYGTFVHPNSAGMFFAIATTASLWRYLDSGRRRLDLLFTTIFAGGAIATYSLSGLGSMLAMLVTLGILRQGSLRLKLSAFAAAALIVIGFIATPLGAERLANESSTNLNPTHTRGEVNNTSLGWRLYKWELLLPEWERSPLLGQGLGATVTTEGTSENVTAGKVPHNEYIRYLVETGVIGLGILLWSIKLMLRALARRRVPGTANAAVLATSVLVGCLVNALGDNTFLYTTTGYAVALIVAAALLLPSHTEQSVPIPSTA